MKVLRVELRTGVAWLGVWAVLCGGGAAVSAAAEVAFRDDFDDAQLEAGWTFVREQADDHSLTERPGFFRVQTRRGILGEQATVENLLLRPVTGDFILETRVEFAPTTAQQFAGLIVYSDDEHAVSLGLAFATGDRGDFRGIVLLSLGDDPESDAQTPGGRYDETNAEDPNSVYLRLLRKGDQFVGAFSPDGVSFKDIGTITNDLPDAISVGLGAANGDTPECGSACDESIPADYDFFQISTLDSDAAADDGASVEIGLESVEVTGPDQVSPGTMAEYVAQAVFSDGTASDVTDQAEWTLAPDGLGQVEAGQFTAASVEAVQQVTVVASFSQLTSGGEIIRTGTKLVRITSPPGGGGGGSSGGGLCGAGLVPFWLVTLMGFGQRKFWRRRR